MSISINYSALDGRTSLADGDVVQIVEQADVGCDSGHIQIGVQLDGVTWWKGIEADDLVLAQTQDKGHMNMSEVPYNVFVGRELHLWKAKAFGVHTEMYYVADAHDNMKAGRRYIFHWVKDSKS